LTTSATVPDPEIKGCRARVLVNCARSFFLGFGWPQNLNWAMHWGVGAVWGFLPSIDDKFFSLLYFRLLS
ncbi:MAG: hypothetical protein KDB00_01125, partial [Planctomycetales bacterium]|nr:hypothetical protein [Planctomycetales bacterium]